MRKNPHRQDQGEFKELLKSYEQLRDGKNNTFIYEDGFEQIIDYFIDQDKTAESLEAAEIATTYFPYSSTLMLMRADALLALRRYKECLFILDKAEVLDNHDLTLYIIKTDALLALDRQEEASEILLSALDLFDGEERIELLFELGDVYDDYENFDKLFDCLKMILEQDPNNEEALYKICFWTDHTGRNEEGIKLHQWILDQNPYNELAWFNLGAAYQGLKLYEKAIDSYQFAVAINEKFDYAYRNMGDAFIRLRKYKEAIDSLEKVLVLSLPEAVIFEAIGHCYDKIGNYAQARINYKKACRHNPEDGQLYFKIAGTYMNEGVWRNAIKSLQQALKFHLLQPEYNLALGRCYQELEEYDEAITYFGNVVRIKPKSSKGWVELLECLFLAGLYTEGLNFVAGALENTDNKPIFYYYRSAFEYALGHIKQSVIDLDQALTYHPKGLKTFIDLMPSILQNQLVVDIIARHKGNSKRKKS